VESNKQLWTLRRGSSATRPVLSPNDWFLAVGGMFLNRVYIYDLQSGRLHAKFGMSFGRFSNTDPDPATSTSHFTLTIDRSRSHVRDNLHSGTWTITPVYGNQKSQHPCLTRYYLRRMSCSHGWDAGLMLTPSKIAISACWMLAQVKMLLRSSWTLGWT
jgi:hypothetical protein